MATHKPKTIQEFDWKNHPVVIASGSAAATFLFSIAIFTQIVLPTQLAKLDAELSQYKTAKEKAEASLRTDKEKISALEAEIGNLKQEKIITEQLLEDTRAGNLFSPGNPYPSGLSSVKIGAKRNDIEKEYSSQNSKIDKEDPEQIAVDVKNSPFETVVYYFTDATPKATVTHISFNLPIFNSKYSEDFLFKKLNENFGQPITDSSGKHYKWTVGSKYSIYAYGNDGYVLMPRNLQPIYWRGQ